MRFLQKYLKYLYALGTKVIEKIKALKEINKPFLVVEHKYR